MLFFLTAECGATVLSREATSVHGTRADRCVEDVETGRPYRRDRCSAILRHLRCSARQQQFERCRVCVGPYQRSGRVHQSISLIIRAVFFVKMYPFLTCLLLCDLFRSIVSALNSHRRSTVAKRAYPSASKLKRTLTATATEPPNASTSPAVKSKCLRYSITRHQLVNLY